MRPVLCKLDGEDAGGEAVVDERLDEGGHIGGVKVGDAGGDEHLALGVRWGVKGKGQVGGEMGG